MEAGPLILRDLGMTWNMIESLLGPVLSVRGIGSGIYFLGSVLLLLLLYHFNKSIYQLQFKRNKHFSKRFRPESRESAERAWRSYQEETESQLELPSILKGHKVSRKGSVRRMLCTDSGCEVCNSVALEADLLFKSILPELASWDLPSDLPLTLPSNLSLVPSSSQNIVPAHTSPVNPSSSLAVNILPGHTLSLSPITPMDLSFSLPHSPPSATIPFQDKSPIGIQSSTTSRTHISVLAHTSTVVRTSLTMDTSTENTPPVVLAPPSATELSGALTSSLQPKIPLASSVIQTPSVAQIASVKPNIPKASSPSPNSAILQESASQCITHTSLLDLQSETISSSLASTPFGSPTVSFNPPPPVAPTLSLAPSPPVARPLPAVARSPPAVARSPPVVARSPPAVAHPVPVAAAPPPLAPAAPVAPAPSIIPTPPLNPTLSFAPTLPVAPVPPVAPGPFVTPAPYFAPMPSVAPAPSFAPAPFFAPASFFAPRPTFAPSAFDSAPSVAPTLSVASIPPVAQISSLDQSFLIDPAYLRAHSQLCHSPYVAHTTSLDPNNSRNYTTSVPSNPALAPTHSSDFTSSKVPIFSRGPDSSLSLSSSRSCLKVPTPSTKPTRTSRFCTSSPAPKASLACTSSMTRTSGDTLTSSSVHLPSTYSESNSHTPSQASTFSTICTPSVVHTSPIVCTTSTTPTTSAAPILSQASPPLEDETCSQVLRSSLFFVPSSAQTHSTAQTTSVATTTFHETICSQVLRFSLPGITPVVHNPPRADTCSVPHTPPLNVTSSSAHTATPSRKPSMDHVPMKKPTIFLNPTPFVDLQPPQQSSPTPRCPKLPLAPATSEEPDLLSTLPKVSSIDDTPLMTSAPLTSDTDESCATFSGSPEGQNSQEYLMLPNLFPIGGSRLEPLSLGLQKVKKKGTLPIPMPEEKPCDSETSEWQEKNLVPLRLQLSEKAMNAGAQQHPEAEEVSLLSPGAQEFLEMHLTEKVALHIWKEKELLSQRRSDLPPCFRHITPPVKKLSLVLKNTESSVKYLSTPDSQSWSRHGADQPFLDSEGSFVNNMKPEQMSNSRRLHKPISLILTPNTLHFLNKVCSGPGWGPESTVSRNRQCIQLFWGLPSLHSESLVTTYMGSSSPSWLGATIKLPLGDNPLVFFNDLSYLHLPNSANQPSLPSPIQHLKLLPTSSPTSSHPSSPPPPPVPSPLTPPVTLPPPPPPSPSPFLPQIRTFTTDPEETTIRIPAIYLPKFQALEWHLLQKQLQSLWGVPHIVQRSHEAFKPLPLQLPQAHKSPCPQVQISNWPQDLSFLTEDVKKLLETHLRRRLIQHHWGLSQRVKDSIKHLVPQTIPQQDSARPGKPKLSTFQDLKHFGKKDTASDSTAALGVASAIIPKRGPASHTDEIESDLEKSSSSSQQEALQKHFLQKSVAIQRKVVPEMVSHSWADARLRSVSLQPTQPLQKQPKRKEIALTTPSMENTATQTPPQPQPQSQLWAPSPTEEVIYQAEPCKDIPFLDPETKKILESHIRHMHIRLRWGLPRKVLESIYLFKLKNPLIQISSPIIGKGRGPDIMVGERNFQEIWVGGVAREASAVVLDILEAEKGSWNIGKELWEAPQAGGDWEENAFSPRPGLMDRGPRQHITETGSRKEILELTMKHPSLLPRQRDRNSIFRKQFQGQGIQEQRVFPLIKDSVLNKSISFSKLNFHLKKRMVEKVLGIPLRVRESREMATRSSFLFYPQLDDSVVAEETESFQGLLHERESEEKVQMAEGQTLSLRTLNTQDLSHLIFKQFTDEEEFNLRVLEQSYSESHTPHTLVQHHALGFQTTEVSQSYSLEQLNEDMTGAQGPGTRVKLEGKSPSLRAYQKLPSQVTDKKQAKKRIHSQRKGSLSKPPIDQGMRDKRQEKDPNLLKGHTSNSRWPSQGPMNRVLGFSKQEGVLQRKIPLAEKMKGFLKWLCPKKKIRGTEKPLPRAEVAIAGEITEQSPFTVKPPSKGSRVPFSHRAPSAPEDMTVVGLILQKKMGMMDELYAWEENQQQEKKLQIVETQAEPTGSKFQKLRALSSSRAQEGNSKSRGHGKSSEGHWERQAQDRERRVKQVKKTVRFGDQHLAPEKLTSIASEVSISSGQFHYRHRGSSFSRTLGHSQHYPKPPLGGILLLSQGIPRPFSSVWSMLAPTKRFQSPSR
uniref:Uncharacterized protein LOC110201441 isoform X1 n=2 Tax=Phascolarctos cinereus TaxID=38626 RepID=A0A6P5JNF9_PHACI|nr:uncharacterized protein LOC110201441 isoform X1 [Phascolarctos cinereus]